jgi:predicted deacylase
MATLAGPWLVEAVRLAAAVVVELARFVVYELGQQAGCFLDLHSGRSRMQPGVPQFPDHVAGQHRRRAAGQFGADVPQALVDPSRQGCVQGVRRVVHVNPSP